MTDRQDGTQRPSFWSVALLMVPYALLCAVAATLVTSALDRWLSVVAPSPHGHNNISTVLVMAQLLAAGWYATPTCTKVLRRWPRLDPLAGRSRGRG